MRHPLSGRLVARPSAEPKLLPVEALETLELGGAKAVKANGVEIPEPVHAVHAKLPLELPDHAKALQPAVEALELIPKAVEADRVEAIDPQGIKAVDALELVAKADRVEVPEAVEALELVAKPIKPLKLVPEAIKPLKLIAKTVESLELIPEAVEALELARNPIEALEPALEVAAETPRKAAVAAEVTLHRRVNANRRPLVALISADAAATATADPAFARQFLFNRGRGRRRARSAKPRVGGIRLHDARQRQETEPAQSERQPRQTLMKRPEHCKSYPGVTARTS